jgi:hypothetical protein
MNEREALRTMADLLADYRRMIAECDARLERTNRILNFAKREQREFGTAREEKAA